MHNDSGNCSRIDSGEISSRTVDKCNKVRLLPSFGGSEFELSGRTKIVDK